MTSAVRTVDPEASPLPSSLPPETIIKIVAERYNLNLKKYLPVNETEGWITVEETRPAPNVNVALGVHLRWDRNSTVTLRVDAFKFRDGKIFVEKKMFDDLRFRRIRLFHDFARDCLEIPIVREILVHTNDTEDGLVVRLKSPDLPAPAA